MQPASPTLILSTILAVFGVISSVIGFLSWYDARVVKNYAARRDFQELKQMLRGHSDEIKQLKAADEYLTALLIDYLPQEGESPSQILNRLKGKG